MLVDVTEGKPTKANENEIIMLRLYDANYHVI